jgi:hypothetical protein
MGSCDVWALDSFEYYAKVWLVLPLPGCEYLQYVNCQALQHKAGLWSAAMWC